MTNATNSSIALTDGTSQVQSPTANKVAVASAGSTHAGTLEPPDELRLEEVTVSDALILVVDGSESAEEPGLSR